MKYMRNNITLILLSLLFTTFFAGCFLFPSTNHAPTITSTEITTATVEVAYTYDVDATDPDGDTLTYSLTTKPAGMTINPSTGLINWTPTATGDYNVTIEVADNGSPVESTTQSFTIHVEEEPEPTNQAPIITSTPFTTATVNQTYAYDVEATDPDGDTLTYSLTTKPADMTIDSITGVINWTPDTIGDYDVNVNVEDGTLNDIQSFIIKVSKSSPTSPPVIPPDNSEEIEYKEVVSKQIDLEVGGVIEVTDESSEIYGTRFIIDPASKGKQIKGKGWTEIHIFLESILTNEMVDYQGFLITPIAVIPDSEDVIKGTLEIAYNEDKLSNSGVGKDTIPNAYRLKTTTVFTQIGYTLIPILAPVPIVPWEKVPKEKVTHENNKVIISIDEGDLSYLYTLTVTNCEPDSDLGNPLPGDLIYRLSDLGPNDNWLPGHVGIYVGTRYHEEDGVYNVIEELGSILNPFSGGVIRTYYPDITEFGNGPTYMGAREPSGQNQELSHVKRNALIDYTEKKMGMDYAYKDTFGFYFGWAKGDNVKGKDDKYNCVGLSEDAYESVGIDIVSDLDEGNLSNTDPPDAILTPQEQLYRTVPASGIIDQNTPPKISELKSTPWDPIETTKTFTISCYATDQDQDSLTYIWTIPGLSEPLIKGKNIEWVIPNILETYTISCKVIDNYGGEDEKSIKISVSDPINHPPSIWSTPVTSATVNQLYTYNVRASDPDEGDPQIFSLTTTPSGIGMSIDPFLGLISWTPDTAGDYDVTVKVSDGELSDTQSFTITVQNESAILSSITVSPSTMSLVEGGSQTISSVTAHYSDGSGSTADIALNACTYDSNNTGVATADAGVIAAVVPGTATITVSYTEGGITKTDTVEVTVNAITPTPETILSPVVGDLKMVSSSEQCSITKWCFNQHKSGGHCQGGGICQADDTYAWDVNLNTPSHDSDNGMPVYAVEGGIISQTYGGCINAGGSYGQLLIEHTYQGNLWWSGYLHLKDIQVTTGQSVDQNTLLGYISNISPETIPNHLHFVVYKGQNSPSGLISFDANIIPRDFSQTYYTITASAGPNGSISPSGDVTVNQGSDESFTITPDTGYYIADVLVDGSSIGAVSSYTFTNVTEDHIISATFSAAATGPVHNLTKDTYYNTIQEALDDADSDNTIEVADGTYDESITFPSNKVIILQSVNGASSTIIRGNNDFEDTVRLYSSLEGTTLEGFTITHVNGLIGKGIGNHEGNLSINNCIISNNNYDFYYAAVHGGGIYNSGTLTITGSTISGNYARYGGGIESCGPLTITGSTISGNSADFGGGGVYLSPSETTTIGGENTADKNTICGNYKTGEDPSLDQQIRDTSGSLYETYKDTNYISAYCGVPSGPVHNLTKDTYYNTIQEALDDADSLGGDTIEVDDGTHNESITFPANKVVTLQSASGIRDNVIIQGANNFATVTTNVSSTGTTLRGFTITHTGGNTGRGIYIGSGNLIVDNCIISSNTSDDSGGGIYNNNGTLTITSSTISYNTATNHAGGIDNDGTLDITSSTISDNTATYSGGGINNYDGTLTITSSTISDNTATRGGGINNYGTLTVASSTISGNTAANNKGGGIYSSVTLTITSSTISGNTAADDGGGIHNCGTLTITGSTISGNTSGRYGGGIGNDNGTLTITSSTISDNTADDVGGGIGSFSGTLTITGSSISGNTADGGGGGIYLSSSENITIGGESPADKNTICGNYKTEEDPSLDQQIRDDTGSLYETYKDTNYISAYCGVPGGSVHNLTKNTYYDTIQAAYDDADSGNTIEVADGTYIESVRILKEQLTIKSKNGAEKTTIKAVDGNNNTLLVQADYTYINGFTIEGAGTAGYYKDRRGGIHISGANYCTISNNIISNNSQGIFVFTSNNNTISNNMISNNSIRGILLESADYNTFSNNIIDSNGSGIDVHAYYGLTGTYYSYNNTIINNTISNNGAGIRISGGSDNLAYLNNVIDNNTNGSSSSLVTSPWNSPEEITYSYNGTTYTNYLGNYWSNYAGNDSDGNGIGDTPYIINEEPDNYPLMEPFENY